MKKNILLTYFSLLTCSLLANDLKQEKKLLTETIKANYDSWQIKKQPVIHDDSVLFQTDETFIASDNGSSPNPVLEKKHIFSNFSFEICKSQAIVKFHVDYQVISAFFEKKDGQWSLVCAALITPDI